MTASSVTRALDLYVDALGAVHAPVLEWLLPGATPAELDAAEAHAGFEFPPDARAVWAWHNGSIPPAPERMSYFTPGSWFPDITTAVDRGAQHVSNWVDAMGQESGFVGAHLIALLVPWGFPGLMTIDCAPSGAEDATALRFGREDLYGDAGRSFSVTATIELWTEWIRSQWWTLDGNGRWTFDLTSTPPGSERHQF